MHLTAWSVPQYCFWLMIVSIAIAVLPVWRSPMISSRWPRPIGVMTSITLMPVCSGSSTGWRSVTPGAWTSSGRVPSSLDSSSGPWPSMGRPSGSTTRPSMASPTGTDRTRSVRLTVWPSSTRSAEANTAAPMVFSSRFMAMPMTPSPKSSSSLASVPGRPTIVAMPSPVDATRPTCSAVVAGV